ncbi:hypothetical protein C8024_00185 [Sphingopyxis sp. BSNA05]|nr:hypothetical protein [Sphingopyxis sp. BSNA05]
MHALEAAVILSKVDKTMRPPPSTDDAFQIRLPSADAPPLPLSDGPAGGKAAAVPALHEATSVST